LRWISETAIVFALIQISHTTQHAFDRIEIHAHNDMRQFFKEPNVFSLFLRNIARFSLCMMIGLGVSATAGVMGNYVPRVSTDPRAVYVFGQVNSSMLKQVKAELLRLESEQPGVPMRVYISSGGGYYADGMEIIHVMQSLSSPVETVCVSQCDSMAALILAAGTPGMRSSHPKARIMVHQLTDDPPRGNIRDLELVLSALRSQQDEYTRLMVKYTKKSTEEISAALIEAKVMPAEGALGLGLIDRVIALTN